MRTVAVAVAVAAAVAAAVAVAQREEVRTPDSPAAAPATAADLRFLTLDVFIDTNDSPLAVYQLEIAAKHGDVKIAGIEGSDHVTFREPPHFDPSAMQQERVILAAFNTSEAARLPRGKVRIASIHLQVSGQVEPAFDVKPAVIATVDGVAMQGAKVSVEIRRLP